MSREVLTPPTTIDVDESLDDLDGSLSVSPSDVLDRLWRLFIAMRTGLVLILGLGLLTLIGTVLTQAPAGVRADAQAYASWLDSVRPKYGGWTTVFDKLGFFSVFSSLLFKAILVLLSTSIIACSINRSPRLWKRATHPRRQRSEAFFRNAPLRVCVSSSATQEATVDVVRAVFRSHHYRTLAEQQGNSTTVYADRFRWAPFGTVMAHLSFVLILVGAFLTATAGFKDTQVAAPVGTKVAIGHGTGMTLEATSFSDSYYLDGSPKDYSSELVLYKNGAVVKRQTVRVNHPMRWGGVSFFQSFFGIAISMKVQDATGKSLYDAGVPLMWQSQDSEHSIGQFTLPAQNLTVFVVTAASGQVDPIIKAGQVQLEVYKTGQDAPLTTEVVSQGKTATIQGLRMSFERPRQYTGLIVARDPGAVVVWIGSSLMIVGIFLVLRFPHRRIWARIRKTADGNEVICAAMRRESSRRDTSFESSFQQLSHDVQLAVTRPSTTRK